MLICDADEIPSEQACRFDGFDARMMMMRTCHSAVDWLYPAEMPTGVVARWGHIRGRALSDVRDSRSTFPPMGGAGWHLSWLGGPPAQMDKLSVTCHLELPEHEIETIASGRGFMDGSHEGVQMVAVDVDQSWPEAIWRRHCPPSWFRPR